MRNWFRVGRRRTAAAIALGAVSLLVLGAVAAQQNHAREALRYVVHNMCVPGQLKSGDPSPCSKVDISGGVDKGYAILRNFLGTTHYLLVATGPVSGIESAALLAPNAPNYFAKAWEARSYVSEAAGRMLSRDDVILAINSVASRSQDQMHIHLDCVRVDVRDTLLSHLTEIGDRWSPLTFPLAGAHRYMAMWVPGEELGANNPFKLWALGASGAAQNMGDQTLVVMGTRRADGTPGFILLGNHVQRTTGEMAHGEELQDHTCRLAATPGAASD